MAMCYSNSPLLYNANRQNNRVQNTLIRENRDKLDITMTTRTYLKYAYLKKEPRPHGYGSPT